MGIANCLKRLRNRGQSAFSKLYSPVCNGFLTNSINLIAIPKRINTYSTPNYKSQRASQFLTSSRISIVANARLITNTRTKFTL
jgi:hypothetical protein